jgi:transketolase
LTRANEEKERPTLIIGKTIMGKGALAPDGSNFERQVSTHGMPLSDAGGSVEKTIRNLGGDPENPFAIYPDVQSITEKKTEKKQ